MHPDVRAYLEALPEEPRARLLELRSMILAAAPQAEEKLAHGFPCYFINGAYYAAYANRAKGPMFYIMCGNMVGEYTERLGTLAEGKSCVLYRASKKLSLEQVRAIFVEILEQAAVRLSG